jgi:hypothetical protein
MSDSRAYTDKTCEYPGGRRIFLGMDLDFTADGQVKILMIEFLKGVLEDFSEIIAKTAATPTADHLFSISPEGNVRHWMRPMLCHSITPWRSYFFHPQGQGMTYRQQ